MSRKLHLGAFMRPVSLHTGAWRYPGARPDANFSLPVLRHLIRKLEAARFDAFFMADHLAVLNMPRDALKRSHTVTSFEPFTLLSALAMATDRIGLVATCSTTYEEPYNVARRYASLDHLSGGRAAWNVVTTGNPETAANFGREEHPEHSVRYARAREFFDVVTGLWDSWADDAFVRDVEAGIYFDPDKMHVLDHKGEFLNVRGPLNIARPVQGWPVIVQAGSSEPGKQLAAETAEVVFCAPGTLERGQAFYKDVKGRLPAAGREPDSLKILPAAFVLVADTDEEARARRDILDSLVHYDSGIRSLSILLDYDVSGFDPDGPLPEVPVSRSSISAQEQWIEMGREPGMTIRKMAAKAGSQSGLSFVGSPKTIADGMEEWLVEYGSDGFNLTFPYIPAGVDDFCDKVIPELQRRGIFRTEYEGTTLRDHLGLKRPPNRFFT